MVDLVIELTLIVAVLLPLIATSLHAGPGGQPQRFR